MPVKKRLSKVREHRITPEAIAAFEAGGTGYGLDLRRALGLRPWEASPLDVLRYDAAGEGPPTWETCWAQSWPQAAQLLADLRAAGARDPAGPLVDEDD